MVIHDVWRLYIHIQSHNYYMFYAHTYHVYFIKHTCMHTHMHCHCRFASMQSQYLL